MVEVREAGEAELDEPLRGELSPGELERCRDLIDEGIEIASAHRSFVECPRKGRPKLRGVEALALAASLPNPEAIGDDPLVGGEPVSA